MMPGFQVLIINILLLIVCSQSYAQHVVVPKVALFNIQLDDEHQIVDGDETDLEFTSIFPPIAIEYEYLKDSFSYGGEFTRYGGNYQYDDNGNGIYNLGRVYIDLYTLNIKYHINLFTENAKIVNAYIGVGAGVGTVTGYNTNIDAKNDFAYQYVMGFVYKPKKKFGVRFEYKKFFYEPELETGGTINLSGNGVFIGFAIYF